MKFLTTMFLPFCALLNFSILGCKAGELEQERAMANFYVASIGINALPDKVFEYVADPYSLPKWTEAFAEINKDNPKRALLVTPNGQMQIFLEVKVSKEFGTVDWYMHFPDGSVGTAFSRITPNDGGATSVYSFVLMAPPVPLEQLEGALAQQKEIITKELRRLKANLEKK